MIASPCVIDRAEDVYLKRMLRRHIKDRDMPRHLDLTALRSFTAVADAGGVTRAAAQLNLTQSAVSMQLKRLEEWLGLQLIDRSRARRADRPGRAAVGYARRLLALNDEAWGRLTHPAFEGVLNFGVPQDIMYPHVPRVCRRFGRSIRGCGCSCIRSTTGGSQGASTAPRSISS